MPHVAFHILDGAVDHERLVYACRVAEKAFQRGHQVHVRVTDEAMAGELDTLLWTFRDRSFVPHARADAAAHEREPVMIGVAGDAPDDGYDVLINLAPEAWSQPESFERIVEVGNNDPQVLRNARSRYRWYRERGLEPEHHTVGGT
ncbi:MAG: DNA polymerase III subunit chi [Ectothiorhodospiraceae bacterium]